MTVKLEFKNGRALDKALKKLDEKVEKKIAVQASRAGAAEFRKELKKTLPVSFDTDDDEQIHLKDSVGIRKEKGKAIRHVVGVTGLARAYAHIVEFGSKYVTPGGHWRRTIENHAEAVFAAMAKKLRDGIEKHG